MTAFDINLKEPSLLDYLPRVTETADVIDTFGKMQLMDRLIVNDGVAKVIDLGFHAFDDFFKMTGEIGFMKEAERRGVRRSSCSLPIPTAPRRAPFRRCSSRFRRTRWSPSTTNISCAANCRRPLPAAGWCRSRAAGVLEDLYRPAEFSFTGYLRNEKDSSTELHQWIRENYFSFRELELNLMLQGS